MPILSHRANEIQDSPIRRLVPYADAAKKRGISVFHLNIGQPDIKTPNEILESVRNFHENVLAYGPSQGLPVLREEICRYFKNFKVDITPEEVAITTGGSEAILFALMAIANVGDEILVPEPFYTNFNGFAVMSGTKLVPVPTTPENGYAMPPLADFEKRITSRTKAILYCSPNNPTGAVCSHQDIELFIALAIEKNLWIIADEVYREFVYDRGNYASILSFPEIADRAIMVDSISKRFSACGARIGMLICRNREIMQVVNKFGQARLCPPTIGQIAAIAGYQALDKFLSGMIAEYQHRRDIVCEELAKIPGAIFTKPAGAFYIMPKLPIDDAEKFASWLLTDFSVDGSTVMVAPGDGFYESPENGKQEIRLAYVLKESDLKKAMHILVKGVGEYNS